jgi:CheY-like chemotaxis protein
MKILVIEDDPTDRKLAGAVLKMSGHIVRERTSAEEAMVAIAADRPDVILMDMRLPGIDGLSLAHILKSETGTRDIPIIAVTAYPEQYQRAALLAAGFEAYIVKPIDTRELSKQVERAAQGKPQ